MLANLVGPPARRWVSSIRLPSSLLPTTKPTMSTQRIYSCTNPTCEKGFVSLSDLKRHQKLAKKCKWWLAHIQEAQVNQIASSTVVPGSIHDDTAAHFDREGDRAYIETGADDEEDDTDASSSESSNASNTSAQGGVTDNQGEGEKTNDEEKDKDNGEGQGDEVEEDEDEAAEIEARNDMMRRFIEAQEDNAEMFYINRPDVAIGEPGPGPSTARSRLGQMIGARARYLDDDGEDGENDDIVVEHPTAGAEIRTARSLYGRWVALFGGEQEDEAAMDVDDSTLPDLAEGDLYQPFASRIDWEIARWMVTENIGHGSFNRLLKIEGVRTALGLSYDHARGLHEKVDSVPRRAGRWYTKHITFPDRPEEVFTLRHRDILDAIRSLWGDPELADKLVYKPCRMFHQPTEEGQARGARFFNEMWTGNWWWYIQDQLPEGHTLAPLIIATDKTQLTQFSGSRQAYPVYLTLGNIPSHIRRKPSQQACILVAYLPVEKMSRGNLAKSTMGARYQRLFHTAMSHLFEPLIDAGKEGVEMTSGDGKIRMVHPILASYVADYPEQCLITSSKYGSCPKCQCPPENLQDSDTFPPRSQEWTSNIKSNAKAATSSTTAYREACYAENVNPNVTHPFWENLPYTDIHLSTTPDVLHQLYQGVLKHLISWCQILLTEKEMDRRIRRLPHGVGLRHFKNGISALSQISGAERKDMGKILLGCIVDELDPRAVTAVRAILDFIYLAQYATHDNTTLGYMEAALQLWHDNKSYFTDVIELREDINIPKFHSLQHYVSMIRTFGTTNNFNTEMFERLHIEFAKKGWRASNHRDEFTQMTTWVNRQENVKSFERYLTWRNNYYAAKKAKSAKDAASSTADATERPAESQLTPPTKPPPNPKADLQRLSLTKNPHSYNKGVRLIDRQHHAPSFSAHLLSWLNGIEADRGLRPPLKHLYLPFPGVDVWHSLKLSHEGYDPSREENESVKASPVEDRFDTVIVLWKPEAEAAGLEGTRIGRIRVIFKLPVFEKGNGGIDIPYPPYWPKEPLAYIEWYSTPHLSARMRDTHNMPSVSKPPMGSDGAPPWSIIPLSNIRQSCMLFPKFGTINRKVWDTNKSVLDTCSTFYVNNWLSLFTYQTVYM
ncbi:hypothetical protein CYLTODRAFT_125515 [Cylindrobasidium torrendii FP15055 ss-10]|uniref:C2H2-type domain-containing protein n=1 Tax=Cylindrobasidium torrendii FP15055 ss-10 TaxID=1314674 RepID=A0A0D7B0V5_9AGAR|nr:hypothetical protein CYLTODRAFT_125515 [Cylindrobasidium torrendii FP15055 ss-10]